MKKTTTKTAPKKSAKKSAERVLKAEQVITSAPKLKSFIALHDSRPLTSAERAYDNAIIRNSLAHVDHVAIKTADVAVNVVNKVAKNDDINKGNVARHINGKVKKGDIVTFAGRSNDTKTGNMKKLMSFMTSNICSGKNGQTTDKLFVFYVNK